MSTYFFGSCKKKVQSKSGASPRGSRDRGCPAYSGLVCTVSVALNFNMSHFLIQHSFLFFACLRQCVGIGKSLSQKN